jgi:transcription initiation factor IIE alpha subunit
MPQKSITNLILVKDLLDTVGGQDAIELVKICEKKRKMVTDEEISKKMKLWPSPSILFLLLSQPKNSYRKLKLPRISKKLLK